MKEIKVAKRISHIRYEIRDLVLKAKEYEKMGKKIYYLNIGDPNVFDFKPPLEVRKEISKVALSGEYSNYAPSFGDPELRELIGKKYGVGADNVFVTSGLSEGIDFLFATLMEKGDNFLLPSPGYPLYNSKARYYGGIDNYYETDKNFQPIVDEMEKQINKRTKAMVIINPNNPTGVIYSQKKLKQMINLAAQYNIPIFADEIYDKLPLDGKPVKHIYELARKSDDVKIISGGGISKVYSYPGSRVGFMTLHGQGMEKIKDAFQRLSNQRLSVNGEMQRGALVAYKSKDKHLKKMIEKLRKRRDIVYNAIKNCKYLSAPKPKAAFYSFIKINSDKWKTDEEFVMELLKETGVLVVNGSAFSPILKDKYFRLVFLPQEKTLKIALDKILDFVRRKNR